MNKEILQKLVDAGLSTYKIAKEIGLSQTATRYWIGKYGLSPHRIHHCGRCGETDPKRFTDGRFSECRKCRVRFQKNLYKKYKNDLVIYKGGKCEICGYNKCIAALDFHHINPDKKDPNWKKMRCWTPSKVKGEIDKCQLVCKNCHSEIHYK